MGDGIGIGRRSTSDPAEEEETDDEQKDADDERPDVAFGHVFLRDEERIGASAAQLPSYNKTRRSTGGGGDALPGNWWRRVHRLEYGG